MLRLVIALAAGIPTLLLLLAAFLVLGVLRFFVACVRGVAGSLEPRYVPWKELIIYDSHLGWKPRARVDANYLADRDDVYRLLTDEEGWPGTHSIEESPVVAIGDSFAFGYGVDTAKSFACVKPELRIKAIGAPGYSMVQSLMLTEQLAPRLAGKLVVWLVCLENDLEDNLSPSRFGYRSPFVRPGRVHGHWELVNEHVSPQPWRCTVWSDLLFPHVCVPGLLADRVYAASDHIIRRASTCCDRVGAQFLVFTIPTPTQLTDQGRAALASLSGHPDKFDAYLPDRRLRESCERYGVSFAAGLDYLCGSDYKRFEGIHWNEQGHRRMARVLGQLYGSIMSGELKTTSLRSVSPHGFEASERAEARA
jgi:hypothetical protein